MARVVVTETALADLRVMIRTHSLPTSTLPRVRATLAVLAEFPRIGPALTGRWQGLRFILGPWPWMLVVYAWDEVTGEVAVITIQDARSASASTSRQ